MPSPGNPLLAQDVSLNKFSAQTQTHTRDAASVNIEFLDNGIPGVPKRVGRKQSDDCV